MNKELILRIASMVEQLPNSEWNFKFIIRRAGCQTIGCAIGKAIEAKILPENCALWRPIEPGYDLSRSPFDIILSHILLELDITEDEFDSLFCNSPDGDVIYSHKINVTQQFVADRLRHFVKHDEILFMDYDEYESTYLS